MLIIKLIIIKLMKWKIILMMKILNNKIKKLYPIIIKKIKYLNIQMKNIITEN